jgi:hypothetical protein
LALCDDTELSTSGGMLKWKDRAAMCDNASERTTSRFPGGVSTSSKTPLTFPRSPDGSPAIRRRLTIGVF